MTAKEIFDALNKQFGARILEAQEAGLNPFIKIAPQDLLSVATTLKTIPELSFDALMCLSGVDYPDSFTVVYHFFSMQHRHKLVLKVELSKDNPSVASVANIWQTANWFEREVYDLYGIKFGGHPNLTRILMPDDWEGHPLRKDYKYPETYRELPL